MKKKRIGVGRKNPSHVIYVFSSKIDFLNAPTNFNNRLNTYPQYED